MSLTAEKSGLPSETIQGMLQVMKDIASENPYGNDQPLSSAMEAPVGSILGIELTPVNILFFRAMVFSFFLQPILLYTAWFMFPSLAKHRKRLSWTLTFFCAVLLILTGIWEVGYMRPTLYSLLGWDKLAGSEATLFSYWTPTLNEWILQFRNDDQNAISTIEVVTTVMSYKTSDSWASFQDSIKLVQEQLIPLLLDAKTWKGLLGYWMRWVISLPVFSLRPIPPARIFSTGRPYLLGGGGRLLLSMEELPRDSWFSSVLCGYFVGYCLGDLILGLLHYAKEVGPASGWMHHFLYTGLVYQVARAGRFNMFMASGSPLEGKFLVYTLSCFHEQGVGRDMFFILTHLLALVLHWTFPSPPPPFFF